MAKKTKRSPPQRQTRKSAPRPAQKTPQRVPRVDVIGAGEIHWGRELAHQHKRWQGDKVTEALRTLLSPTGAAPPRDELSNADLIQKVLSFLKEHGVHPLPSTDTILRAAGRKTRRR